jgi:peptidyl-prolyl cis-trans isomerase A (cyclophilin A)
MICSKIFQQCLAKPFLAIVLLFSIQSATANTTVRVITSLGDFSIELFDDVAPVTVTNFLNYVNSGRFNGTVIHRSVPNFIIQGGWLTFDQASSSLNPITIDAAIQNEFNLSNTRGTVAMAKQAGNPDSATNQWFINLTDNSGNLDAQNGGFTVFGEVVGDGMTIVDSISSLPTFTLAGLADFPLVNYVSGTVQSGNFINIAVTVTEEDSPPNFFDETTNILHTTIDAGAVGLISASFSINATEPNIVIQLNFNSIQVLTEGVDNMASFDAATGQLVLPELFISGTLTLRNLNFMLSDAEQFLFTLESFEQI